LPVICNHQLVALMIRSAQNHFCHLPIYAFDISETMQTKHEETQPSACLSDGLK